MDKQGVVSLADVAQHLAGVTVYFMGEFWLVFGLVDGGISCTVDTAVNLVFIEKTFNSLLVADVKAVDISEIPLVAGTGFGSFAHLVSELSVAPCDCNIHGLLWLFFLEGDEDVRLIEVFFHVFKLVRQGGPNLDLFFEADDSFDDEPVVFIKMVIDGSGDADIERLDAFMGNGFGFVDGVAEPDVLVGVVVGHDFGNEDVPHVDADGKADDAMFFNHLVDGFGDEVSDLSCDVYGVCCIELVFGIDDKEALRREAGEVTLGFLGYRSEGFEVNLIDTGSESFSSLEQVGHVFDFEIEDSGLRQYTAATIAQLVNGLEVAIERVFKIFVCQRCYFI